METNTSWSRCLRGTTPSVSAKGLAYSRQVVLQPRALIYLQQALAVAQCGVRCSGAFLTVWFRFEIRMVCRLQLFAFFAARFSIAIAHRHVSHPFDPYSDYSNPPVHQRHHQSQPHSHQSRHKCERQALAHPRHKPSTPLSSTILSPSGQTSSTPKQAIPSPSSRNPTENGSSRNQSGSSENRA